MARRTCTYEEKCFPFASTEADECRRHGYELCDKTLGNGAYARVKLAYVTESKMERNAKLASDLRRKGHNMVAIKIIPRKDAPSEYIMKFLQREVECMKTVYRHEHLILLYETFHSDLRVYLVIEFAAGGDLLEYINSTSLKNGLGGLGEDLSRKLFRQLVSGIAHCHQLNVVHRDLKCENVLLDEYNNVKITDFGFAVRISNNKSQLLKTFCGSYAYAAPEILSATNYDGKLADIWSLGVILFAMVNGKLPFNDGDLTKLLQQTRQSSKLEFKPWITTDCQDLIRKLLRVKPLSRPKTQEILRHAWMTTGQPKSARLQKLMMYTDVCKLSPEDLSVEDIEDENESDELIDFHCDVTPMVPRKDPSLRMSKTPGCRERKFVPPPRATVPHKFDGPNCADLVLNGENVLPCASNRKPTSGGDAVHTTGPKNSAVKANSSKQKSPSSMAKLLQQKRKKANEVRCKKILDAQAAGETLTAQNVFKKSQNTASTMNKNTEKDRSQLEKKKKELRRKLLGIPIYFGDYKDLLKLTDSKKNKQQIILNPVKGERGGIQQKSLNHAEARVGLPNIGTGMPLPPLPPYFKEKQREKEFETVSFRYKYSREKKVEESTKSIDKPLLRKRREEKVVPKSSPPSKYYLFRAKQALEKHCKSLTSNNVKDVERDAGVGDRPTVKMLPKPREIKQKYFLPYMQPYHRKGNFPCLQKKQAAVVVN